VSEFSEAMTQPLRESRRREQHSPGARSRSMRDLPRIAAGRVVPRLR